jgi:TM2 domain-containing membrane protein YozV
MNQLCRTVIIFSYFFFISSYSFVTISAQSSDLFSYNNRLKFGNYLFISRDFLRAVDEYRACLEMQKNDTLQFKIGQAFFKMGKFENASEEYRTLFFSQNFSRASKIEFLKTMFVSENYNRIIGYPFDPKGKPVSDIQQKLHNLSFLLTDETLPGEEKFFAPFNDREVSQLYKYYIDKKEMPLKSPAMAAILSTVIPGMGKIYTGDYGDGITAFLMTGIFTFLAYDNFRAGHKFRGWLFTGLSGLFYAGNIYGSATSAQIYNAKVKADFEVEFKVFLDGENYFLPPFRF